MLRSLHHPWLWRVLGCVLVIAVIVASLVPGSQLPQLGISDKWEHAITYVVLTLWFAGMYPRSRYIVIAGLLFILGVTIEFAQGAMALGRQRDVLDVLANSAGICAGLILALLGLGNWVQRIEGWTRRS